MNSPFDDFAWFYNRHWAPPFAEWQRPAIEQLLLPFVRPGGTILDVCCGTGTLARDLASRGYAVIAIDRSHGMLRIARENRPEGLFIQADASHFCLKSAADAAVSVFDSLNHIMDAGQLTQAFSCIHDVLRPGACFLFDVNTTAAYGERWDNSFCEVQPDHAFFLRGKFDRGARVGQTEVTMFQLVEGWKRSDIEIRQRPWDVEEIKPMLQSTGFDDVRVFRAIEDLRMRGHYGIGRVYVCARRSASNGQRMF